MSHDFNEQAILLLVATVALVAGYEMGKLDGREDERQRHRCAFVPTAAMTLGAAPGVSSAMVVPEAFHYSLRRGTTTEAVTFDQLAREAAENRRVLEGREAKGMGR